MTSNQAELLALITGARGFIGRHLAKRLAGQGFKVIGLGHGQWIEQDLRSWGLKGWLNGEVSAANLDALKREHGSPSQIFHLAGGSAVAPSFAAPAEDFNRSVVAAMTIGEWVRNHSPRAQVVMASSAAVYGSGHVGAIAEFAECHPYSPYGFHKRMSELALESYAKNFSLNIKIVRFFSVYGTELRKQLLWDTCTKLQRSPTSRLQLGGNGRELRDWIHVEDAVEVLTLAASMEDPSFVVLNGGTGTSTPVSDVAHLIMQAWGGVEGVDFSNQSRAGDPQSLVANAKKLAAMGKTSFKPLRAGIEEYVSWYKLSQAKKLT